MPEFKITGRSIGPASPTYLIAEMSANHGGSFERALEIVRAAKAAGADAIKVQTFTAAGHTLDCDLPWFKVSGGTPWDGRKLYELYQEASMPWEWQRELSAEAKRLGLDFFSACVDAESLNFLESLNVPVHKISSFDVADLDLVRRAAGTGKPLILSTGMMRLGEIEEVVLAARGAGCRDLALLKCTSAYPADPAEINLRVIPHMAEGLGVVVGLSDHTMGISVPVAAVALGACIIEKHFTLSREFPTPDSAFSLEPREFKAMAESVRTVEKALGRVQYGVEKKEAASVVFKRSLFVVCDVLAGETFTENNIRCIRPGYGLHPRHLDEILGRKASRNIARGTPLEWALLS